ncbi:MAG: hypothetical protein CVT77_01370 [Alphaproteobacteria bacterium HGW-Alphaproteobacteria-16]|nr:MAG: hypothetical protein CVT77_01370 [Alphaproteobacteria bacterium HGW-Alphaproteobacteria-16]
MGWEFRGSGSFGSERDARDFAERNGIDPSDVRTRHKGDRVELEIRESALDGRRLRDRGEGRRNGWG